MTIEYRGKNKKENRQHSEARILYDENNKREKEKADRICDILKEKGWKFVCERGIAITRVYDKNEYKELLEDYKQAEKLQCIEQINATVNTLTAEIAQLRAGLSAGTQDKEYRKIIRLKLRKQEERLDHYMEQKMKQTMGCWDCMENKNCRKICCPFMDKPMEEEFRSDLVMTPRRKKYIEQNFPPKNSGAVNPFTQVNKLFQ